MQNGSWTAYCRTGQLPPQLEPVMAALPSSDHKSACRLLCSLLHIQQGGRPSIQQAQALFTAFVTRQ